MVVPESGNSTFGSLQAGTTRWMAPEFVTSESPLKPNKAGDIYSFGCVMLQVRLIVIMDGLISLPWSKIFSGAEPYSQCGAVQQIIGKIWAREEPFRGVHINMDEAYRLLSLRCLSMKPSGRPSIVEITDILGPAVIR